MVLPLFLGPQTKVTGGEEAVEATVFAASDHSCGIIMFIIDDGSSTELPIVNYKCVYVLCICVCVCIELKKMNWCEGVLGFTVIL